MSKHIVCVSDERHGSYEVERSMLGAIDAELRLCHCITQEDIIEQCADADAILLDLAPMTARAVYALKRCRVINRYGVGYDNVDVEAATAAGIQVTNVPDYCMEDVSDHALALMFACLRQVPMRDKAIRGGSWNIHAQSFRFKGRTLGVIGAGRIARTLIRKVSGFGLKEIMACDPFVSAEEMAAIGVRKVELDELLASSDIVSLHLNVTPATRGIIDRSALAKMKPEAILINTSRGQLVDDGALLDALKNGGILAAGLDTHNKEPLGADSPFFALSNVVLTDHTAYNTVEGVSELKTKSAQNVIDVLSGRRPKYPVNNIESIFI